jgi:UDP-glucose 4-epimerase
VRTRAWIVGSGLLGGAVSRGVSKRDDWSRFETARLPWGDPDAIGVATRDILRALIAATPAGDRWAIVWAAGAAVTSAPQEVLDAELRDFEAVMATIGHEVEPGAPGALFVASSAGGLYGGSIGLPFTEATVPVPISPYGHFKLRIEDIATRLGEQTGLPVLIGRVTNLYGPGQRLDKMQGLISQLALSFYTRKPIRIYVPLETTRNYIYVDDCAALVLRSLDRLADEADGHGLTIVKILGSRQNVSISSLLGQLRGIGKRPPGVILGSAPIARGQAVDLRIFSAVWTDLDDVETVPLATGFHATMLDVLRAIER